MSTLPMADAHHAGDTSVPASTPQADFAICLPSMPADALAAMLDRIQQSLPGQPLLVASPDQPEEHVLQNGGVRLVPYPSARSGGEWVLGAADYLAAARLANERSLSGVLLIGSDAPSLEPRVFAELRHMLQSGVDLAVPKYRAGADEGLVNSALLYPLTRALFGIDLRFPLPLDAAISRRMLSRLSILGSRTAISDEALLWPVAEAAVLGFSIRQTEDVHRALPRPQQADLNILFPAVCSSLFTDVEAKATYWQRARSLPAGQHFTTAGDASVQGPDAEELRELAEGFRLAFANLREIWSLVVPPQSLLALKKLSLTPAESFFFPPNLWARIVYDFALAFHLRTLNRGHLLGSMTPLYLAWVASFLRENSHPGVGAGFLQSTAAAFEQEKPYLVSRWRWPDRFNP